MKIHLTRCERLLATKSVSRLGYLPKGTDSAGGQTFHTLLFYCLILKGEMMEIKPLFWTYHSSVIWSLLKISPSFFGSNNRTLVSKRWRGFKESPYPRWNHFPSCFASCCFSYRLWLWARRLCFSAPWSQTDKVSSISGPTFPQSSASTCRWSHLAGSRLQDTRKLASRLWRTKIMQSFHMERDVLANSCSSVISCKRKHIEVWLS